MNEILWIFLGVGCALVFVIGLDVWAERRMREIRRSREIVQRVGWFTNGDRR